MIESLSLLLAAQLAGEIIVRASGLPLPGPVIGLVLVAALCLWRGVPDALSRTAHGLLAHLGLLFVPAGVGVVQHFGVVADHAVAIGAAIVVSTLATLIVTVGVFRLVARVMGIAADDSEANP